MMMNLKRRALRSSCTTALTALFFVFALPVLHAGVVEIQFTGMDIEYDGVTGFDISTSGPDSLSSVTFLVDGVPTGAALTSGISVDLFIPGVTGIAVGGDSVTSSAGGTLDLVLDGGTLSLELGEVGITYTKIGPGFDFLFGASTAAVDSQALPFGLLLDDPITVSFNTLIDDGSITDDTIMLTSFSGAGSGTVRGGGNSRVVSAPEPASVVLALMAMIGVACSSWVSKETL